MGRRTLGRVGIEQLEPRRLLSGVLAADINPLPSPAYYPFGITKVGDVTYFSQHDGVHGLELWKTDGTDAGTIMIKDIFPGIGSGQPAGFVGRADGVVFFIATDATTGFELWRTDGTDEGTRLVKDINPGQSNSIPTYLTVVGNKVYFFADDGVHGNELWVSDGTEAGTNLVKDLNPGKAGQSPKGMAATGGGLLLFYGTDNVNTGLWKSFGTPGNAALLKSNLYVRQVTPFDGRVFFTDLGGSLWASDGTVAGTMTVQATNSSVGQLVVSGGALYFNRPSGSGLGVFRIKAGQTTVTSMGTFSGPSWLADAGGVLYFADTGTKLYRVGPGDATAHLVATVAPGVSGATIANFTGVGGALYFTLYDPSVGYSLWFVWDSQSQPTGISPLSAARFQPMSFVAAGSRVVFVCDNASTGMELWSSDGEAFDTHIIRDWFPGTAESDPFFSRQVGDKLVFRADDGVHGSEPMTLDASGNLTALGDLNPGRASSYPYGTALVGGNQLILAATTAAAGRELWVTDGTPGGTRFLKDIYAGVTDSTPGDFVEYRGKVYFSATDAGHGLEMWVTDGTTAGTTLFRDGIAGSGSGGFSSAVVMNDVLYFVAVDAAGGSELWRTDGTAAGTSRVKDIYPGSTGSAPSGLTVSGGVLYFSATTLAAGTELWRSDGTDAGTQMVKDLYVGGNNGAPTALTAGPGGLVFFQATDASGKTAWRSDGTDVGTIRLSTTALTPTSFTEMNGSVFFFAGNAAKGVDLWRSDGTVVGTVVVKAIAPPPTTYTPFAPTALMVLNGRMFFLGDDGFTALELWSSDGTAAGTACVQDLAPGSLQGVLSMKLATLDGAIYVSGDNSLYGFEPWRFADEYAPVAWRQSTTFNGAAAYEITFNEAINPPATTDVVLTNLRTGQIVSADQMAMTYDAGTHVLRLTFPGFANGMPPDGDYRLTFGPGVLADVAGNANAEAMDFSFFVLAGDANHDRVVDFNDLVRLAQNYNTFGGKTFADGDFNFDGNVDFNDLVILAQRYNTTLAPPAPSLVMAAAVQPVAAKKKPVTVAKPLFSIEKIAKPAAPKVTPPRRVRR